MKSFKDKLAVITGAASGMGFELAVQLAKAGCHLAVCDLLEDGLVPLQSECKRQAPGIKISLHKCDVSVEEEVLQFKADVQEAHDTRRINLLFNNAGIGGTGSFLKDDREDWERTFNVCWFGVYYCSRAFMPMLVASDEGCIVNTSSINGFWASIGPTVPHTAYSSAKFAVKGFSEALIADLRMHAPHVKAAVVMPGHIGTGIVENSMKILNAVPEDMSEAQIIEVRERMERAGLPIDNLPDEAIRGLIRQRAENFRIQAPMTAAAAADEILRGVQAGDWRILVGDDAKALDKLVRSSPEDAYEPEYIDKIIATGHLQDLVEVAAS